ncbi:heavy metal-responsive transcriptional regulator [Sinomonas halotolerans]|uniref:Heavy metal-responsive transcriptional regulator n=1 Tax=Sinomonas halotolerans TaxID=1644133 RepID=A0ABU9X010_9MICC
MRIGEAAAEAGMTAKALRFYEERGLLPAARRFPNGYRDYDEEALGRLDFIRRSRDAGLSLEQIKDIILVSQAGTTPCRHVDHLLAERLAEVEAQLAHLAEVRRSILTAQERVAGADPEGCRSSEVCSYL